MGKRFSCDSLRVRNTISCSAETGLASAIGATTAAETLNLTEAQLAENLMFLYGLRAPTTAGPKQTLTLLRMRGKPLRWSSVSAVLVQRRS